MASLDTTKNELGLSEELLSLLSENREMLRVISALTRENLVSRTRLQQMGALLEEVNGLRGELGYATANFSASASRVVLHRKGYDIRQVETPTEGPQLVTMPPHDEATLPAPEGVRTHRGSVRDDPLPSLVRELHKVKNTMQAFHRDSSTALQLLKQVTDHGVASRKENGHCPGGRSAEHEVPEVILGKELVGMEQKVERYHQNNKNRDVNAMDESELAILGLREAVVQAVQLQIHTMQIMHRQTVARLAPTRGGVGGPQD